MMIFVIGVLVASVPFGIALWMEGETIETEDSSNFIDFSSRRSKQIDFKVG